MIRSEDAIYSVVNDALENIPRPMTCVELMEKPEVRAAALNRWGKDVRHASEKLSDMLGFMWRREVVDRFSAPPVPNSRARWCYCLKGTFKDYDTPITYKKPDKTKSKGDIEIIEKDGEVVIQLKDFVIVVRPR